METTTKKKFGNWMTRLIVAAVCLQFSIFNVQFSICSAQTIREVFKTMPDSLTPYLSNNNRLDMLDFMEAKMKAVVTNELDGESEMIFLSDDSLSVKMSEALRIELWQEKVDTVSVLCMKRVLLVSNDRSETVLIRYNASSWQVLSTEVLSSTLQRRDEEINNKKAI